jgi:hypothetical protein
MLKFVKRRFRLLRILECENYYFSRLFSSVFLLASLGCFSVLYGVVLNIDFDIYFGFGLLISSLSFFACFRFPFSMLFSIALFIAVYYSFIAFLCRFFFFLFGVEYV